MERIKKMKILMLVTHTSKEYTLARYLTEYHIDRLSEGWDTDTRPIPDNMELTSPNVKLPLENYTAIIGRLDGIKELSQTFNYDLTEYNGKIIIVGVDDYPASSQDQARLHSFLVQYPNALIHFTSQYIADCWDFSKERYFVIPQTPLPEFSKKNWQGDIFATLVVENGFKSVRNNTARGFELVTTTLGEYIPYVVLGFGNEDVSNSIGALTSIDELAECYSHHRTYICGKFATGLPFDNATLEAAAVGIPIVLARESTSLTKFGQDLSSYVYSSADPMDLRKKIQSYFEHKDLAIEASEKVQEMISKHFSFKTASKLWKELLES